jgi:short-subunit dehydrogenase
VRTYLPNGFAYALKKVEHQKSHILFNRSVRRRQFLINNAGISAHGDVLDQSLAELDEIVQVNTRSLLALTHLFGRDMRDQRRGRVLLVSSVCGAVSGIASVAVYSATKAFANSFGIALAREMEPFGVGVTCLLPGAVQGTDFRAQAPEALCWKLPFYSKSAAAVAEAGVRAMLHGEVEVTPGIMNRLYLKVTKPMSPQRLHNLLAEVMWKPIAVPRWLGLPSSNKMSGDGNGTFSDHAKGMAVPRSLETTWRKPLQVRPAGLVYKGLPKSRMLELEMPPVPDQVPGRPITTEIKDSPDFTTTSFNATGIQMNQGFGNQTGCTAPSSPIVIQDHSAALDPTMEDLYSNDQIPIEPALSDPAIIQAQNMDETTPSSTPQQDHPPELEIDVKQRPKPEQIQSHHESVATNSPISRDPTTMPSPGGGVLESPRKTDPGLRSKGNGSELELLLNQYQRQRSSIIDDGDTLGFSLLALPDVF